MSKNTEEVLTWSILEEIWKKAHFPPSSQSSLLWLTPWWAVSSVDFNFHVASQSIFFCSEPYEQLYTAALARLEEDIPG